MSLAAALSRAKTEEDIKDAYIKALGLKNVFKGLVDIQTPEIWFEAKEAPRTPIVMFAQLLVYVRDAHRKGNPLPGFLGVCDREKAALMLTEAVLPIIKDPAITWPKSGSKADLLFATLLQPHLEPHFTLYPINGMEADFINATKGAIREGRIIRTAITPDNLRQVFDKWVAMIGVELGVKREAEYAYLFLADIMHTGSDEAMHNLPARLLSSGDKRVFYIGGELYEIASDHGYRNFWNIYDRPPEERHRRYLLERRDSLLPLDERKFEGEFYTPLHIVDKAYEHLAATLGADWQEKYIVWDMCAGVGNLETKHNHFRNVYMSTLKSEDVKIMRDQGNFPGAEIFQYNYLNDDVTDFGEIDYDLSGKVPHALRQAIADARAGKQDAKPILVLINPPYAESGSGIGKGKENKIKVEQTRINGWMRELDLGFASKELFVQFLIRIREELPTAKLAMFSKLKYVNAPNFEAFRGLWKAKYLGGFSVHSRAFELKGDFPIGFLVWDQTVKTPVGDITTDALDRKGNLVDQKTFAVRPVSLFLNAWIAPPKAKGQLALPLSNAFTPSRNPRKKLWCNGSLGYLFAGNNDLQNASTGTLLSSSIYTGRNGGGIWVVEENLWQAAVVFSVRRLIKPTWLNDRDQFLQPTQPLTDEFKSDCLVWMLFNGSNLTAGADGLQWDNRNWSLVNHFIPYTEAQVGAKGRFESDFMAQYMAKLTISTEARAVLDQGRALWTKFHSINFPKKIRDEYKLNRVDAGWYQVRKALDDYSDVELTDFGPFKAAYADLTEKLRPQVFELGFLPS